MRLRNLIMSLVSTLLLALAISAPAGAHTSHAVCMTSSNPYFTGHHGRYMTSYTAADASGLSCKHVSKLAQGLAKRWHARSIDGFSVRRVHWTNAAGESYGDVILRHGSRRVDFEGTFRIDYGS